MRGTIYVVDQIFIIKPLEGSEAQFSVCKQTLCDVIPWLVRTKSLRSSGHLISSSFYVAGVQFLAGAVLFDCLPSLYAWIIVGWHKNAIPFAKTNLHFSERFVNIILCSFFQYVIKYLIKFLKKKQNWFYYLTLKKLSEIWDTFLGSLHFCFN